jgi:hypothetical protein
LLLSSDLMYSICLPWISLKIKTNSSIRFQIAVEFLYFICYLTKNRRFSLSKNALRLVGQDYFGVTWKHAHLISWGNNLWQNLRHFLSCSIVWLFKILTKWTEEYLWCNNLNIERRVSQGERMNKRRRRNTWKK